MFAVTFLLLAPAQAGALAADFKAQSSTRFHWYNDPFQDRPRGDLLKYGFVSCDRGTCVHNGWYAAQHLYESTGESATEF